MNKEEEFVTTLAVQQLLQAHPPLHQGEAVASGHRLSFGCSHSTGSSTAAALLCSPAPSGPPSHDLRLEYQRGFASDRRGPEPSSSASRSGRSAIRADSLRDPRSVRPTAAVRCAKVQSASRSAGHSESGWSDNVSADVERTPDPTSSSENLTQTFRSRRPRIPSIGREHHFATSRLPKGSSIRPGTAPALSENRNTPRCIGCDSPNRASQCRRRSSFRSRGHARNLLHRASGYEDA